MYIYICIYIYIINPTVANRVPQNPIGLSSVSLIEKHCCGLYPISTDIQITMIWVHDKISLPYDSSTDKPITGWKHNFGSDASILGCASHFLGIVFNPIYNYT